MEESDTRAQLMQIISRRGRRKATGNWCQNLLAQFLQENGSERADHAAQVLESTNETRNQVFQFLPDDLLFKIFISLPAESLFRVQFVCKRWFNLISSPTFVRLYAQQSETLLICQRLAFAPNHVDETTNSYFHFMDLDNHQLRHTFVYSSVAGMVNVLSSCDGLVLVRRENDMSLILTNPVTRKYTELPQTKKTISSNESYGLAFCNKENTYKVVHLFSANPCNIGCRVLSISTRKWKLIAGFSREQLPYRRQKMVYANGKVYWTPQYSHACYHFVTLNLQDEKCITRNLPTSRTMWDQLLEIGGALGFVTHETINLLQVWILKENGSEANANWIKRCSIDLSLNLRHCGSPICSPRNGKDMVFYSAPQRLLCVYDFNKGDRKSTYSRDDIKAWNEPIEKLYIPHRHTLASWETSEEAPC